MILSSRQQLFEVIACPEQLLSKTTGALWGYSASLRFTKAVSSNRPQFTTGECQQLAKLHRRKYS